MDIMHARVAATCRCLCLAARPTWPWQRPGGLPRRYNYDQHFFRQLLFIQYTKLHLVTLIIFICMLGKFALHSIVIAILLLLLFFSGHGAIQVLVHISIALRCWYRFLAHWRGVLLRETKVVGRALLWADIRRPPANASSH